MENQFHFRGNLDVSRAYANLSNICPDVKLSSLGIYKKNDWTKYADSDLKLILLKDIKNGVNENNYQILLHWGYSMLATSTKDDPAINYVRDLKALAGGLFKIPFLMSFKEKGLPNFNCTNEAGFGFKKIILEIEGEADYSLEREFFRGRFGNPIIRERYYSNDTLDGMDTLYVDDKGRLLLKHDDTTRWSYQQWNTFFLVGSKPNDDIFRLNEIREPLGSYLHINEQRAFVNLSNGEIHQPPRKHTFNVAQSY